jgi:hypothetical protein
MTHRRAQPTLAILAWQQFTQVKLRRRHSSHGSLLQQVLRLS